MGFLNNMPGHSIPNFTSAACEDALYHYTNANGLIGILSNAEIWGTAYYCANDETELESGKGVLSSLLRSIVKKLEDSGDPRISVLHGNGVDIYKHAERFEERIAAHALTILCSYITCFYRPHENEDFQHGLLSQWRGYGLDGGYAIHFSRNKLAAAIEKTNSLKGLAYELQDVHYESDNPLKNDVMNHEERFEKALLEDLAQWSSTNIFAVLADLKSIKRPLYGLLDGPLQSLLRYFISTKNNHFFEERECRLSLTQTVQILDNDLPVNYFNRGGLLVPYIKTPKDYFELLDCIEWIIVGPGPRMEARIKSVCQLIKQLNLEIYVRPSHIPFTRF